jgi:preprotein translocase subunit YajC
MGLRGLIRSSTVSDSVFVFLSTAVAQAENATSPAPTGDIRKLLPMIAIFIAFFYFFMIRPNQKREKERRDMLASLSKGDAVITNGGIHGTIVGLHEKTVVLRVSDDPAVKMEFARGAVSRVNAKDDRNDD